MKREFAANILLHISRGVFTALAVFAPLFFLPWSVEWLEMGKQYLFWLLVFVSGLFFLLSQAVRGKFVFVKQPFSIPFILFALSLALSYFFSIDRHSSLYGQFGFFGDSLANWIFFIGLFFLSVHIFSDNPAFRKRICLTLAVSFVIVEIVSIAALYVYSGMAMSGRTDFYGDNFPIKFAAFKELALAGAIFFTAVSARLLHVQSLGKRKILFIAKLLALAVTGILLVVADEKTAWLALIGGLLLVINLHFFTSRHNSDRPISWARVSLLTLAVAGSTIFLILPVQLKNTLPLPENSRQINRAPQLSLAAVWNIAEDSLMDSFAWGRGNGNYPYVFSAYRPESLNNGSVWPVRFDHPGVYFLELISTIGLMGVVNLAFIILLLGYFFVLFAAGKSGRPNESILPIIMPLCLAVYLVAGHSGKVSLGFWLLAGITMSLVAKEEIEKKSRLYELKEYEERSRGYAMIAAALFLVAAISLAWGRGAVKQARAVYHFAFGGEQGLELAAKIDDETVFYKLNLAETRLAKAGETAKADFATQNSAFTDLAGESVSYASQAVAKRPNSILASETLAIAYRSLQPYSPEAGRLAADWFKNSLKLEPTNPVLAAELGKVLFVDEKFDEAEKYFQLAKKLKSDYYDADLGLAKVFSRTGRMEEAEMVILNLEKLDLPDPEIFYEGGRLYYNLNNYEKAIEKFSQAARIKPDYSNALYGLGLSYEALGEMGIARPYFKKVAELNPENVELREKVMDVD